MCSTTPGITPVQLAKYLLRRRLHAGHLQNLERKSDSEDFFDVVFGTNCYTSAVRSVKRGCSDLDSESSLSLAFHLTNCFFSKTGKRPYTCAHGPIALCTTKLTREDYLVFSQFVQNVNSMCLFIANSDFNRRAEDMLNMLFKAGSAASEQVQIPAAPLADLSVL
jgi:hypothetical protein